MLYDTMFYTLGLKIIHLVLMWKVSRNLYQKLSNKCKNSPRKCCKLKESDTQPNVHLYQSTMSKCMLHCWWHAAWVHPVDCLSFARFVKRKTSVGAGKNTFYQKLKKKLEGKVCKSICIAAVHCVLTAFLSPPSLPSWIHAATPRGRPTPALEPHVATNNMRKTVALMEHMAHT